MSNAKRNRDRGKECERTIAKLLGGKRVGILGNEDVFTEKFSIEVKSRKQFVARGWMDQAKKNNQQNKIPLVVVHETHKSHEKDFVIMELKDFLMEVKNNGKEV